MDDVEHGGAAAAETSDIGAVAAPVRERRMTAGRKRDAVLRLLRGEPLEIVARELAVTAADLRACLRRVFSSWNPCDSWGVGFHDTEPTPCPNAAEHATRAI